MPVSARRDELDMVSVTVNAMIGEVEPLMGEVKATTDTLAHDLRTPLTRARAQLHRMQQCGGHEAGEIGRVVAEIDEVLERFRAILRISELEARKRHAAFDQVLLSDLLGKVVELYGPLAEERGIALGVDGGDASAVQADEKLLFEAVSNLVDNALKFSDRGGSVRVGARLSPGGPRIVVEDDGPGVGHDERGAILRRFYRGERSRMTPGSGLGLSIVAAIVRLHDFELHLEDAEPGLRVIIDCRSALPTSGRALSR